MKSIPATAGPDQCGSGGILCPDHFGIWQGQGAGKGQICRVTPLWIDTQALSPPATSFVAPETQLPTSLLTHR